MSCRSPVLDRPCPEFVAEDSDEAREAEWITLGSPEYRRASWALFLAGFATFGLIYCVQPLLPTFAGAFSVTPAASSLALSLTTGMLSLAIVVSGGVSQAFDRRVFMFASMASAAVMNIVAGLSPNWTGVLVVRAMEGFVLGGVPAVAMAHLAEEIDPRHLGRAMGLYVGGTAFGGMSGRVGMGLLTEWLPWRASMVFFGVVCAASAIGFLLLLPRPRHARRPTELSLPHELHVFGTLLRDADLLRLFLIGFLLTSAFVCTFNYATFRLTGAPYGLSPMAVSLIFLTYGFGMVSSSWSGILADRLGSRALLVSGFGLMLAGIVCTLATPLVAVGAGISLLTIGYFTAHSVASGTVGRLARSANGHASSLYLLFYYMGSSVIGSCGGWFWQRSGWPGVVGLVAAVATAGVMLSAGTPRGVPRLANADGSADNAMDMDVEHAPALEPAGEIRSMDWAD